MAKRLRYPKLENLNLYNVWCSMRHRCTKMHGKDAKNYSLRGITYSSDWGNWDSFYDDMASSYKQGLTLDRIDNDKGYSKENCRWATREQQNNNKRNNVFYTINGKTKTLSQWSRESVVKPSTIRQRFYCYDWPLEIALGFAQKAG